MKDPAEALPAASMPEEVKDAEMDELFTFIGDEKNSIYILTGVDRKTRFILGRAVVWVRTQGVFQLMIDDAPKAKWYYGDN